MDRINIAKKATRLVAGFAAMSVAKRVITNNVNPQTLPAKVVTWIGACVIGDIISKAAGQHTDAQIDEIVAWWNEKDSEKTPA